jgi:hypothetical protein
LILLGLLGWGAGVRLRRELAILPTHHATVVRLSGFVVLAADLVSAFRAAGADGDFR